MSVLADVILRDTIGNRPAASSSNDGYLFLATDENGGTMYRSNGSTWEQVAPGVEETGTGGSVPAGGDTGQILMKASGTDYDTTWGDQIQPNIQTIIQADLQDASEMVQYIPTPGYTVEIT